MPAQLQILRSLEVGDSENMARSSGRGCRLRNEDCCPGWYASTFDPAAVGGAMHVHTCGLGNLLPCRSCIPGWQRIQTIGIQSTGVPQSTVKIGEAVLSFTPGKYAYFGRHA